MFSQTHLVDKSLAVLLLENSSYEDILVQELVLKAKEERMSILRSALSFQSTVANMVSRFSKPDNVQFGMKSDGSVDPTQRIVSFSANQANSLDKFTKLQSQFEALLTKVTDQTVYSLMKPEELEQAYKELDKFMKDNAGKLGKQDSPKGE